MPSTERQRKEEEIKKVRYLAAGALEHLGNGNYRDGLSDRGPNQDLGQGAGLDGHVVGGQGGDLVDGACV